MVDIFLHIGAEKCGSSSIQRVFSRNRKALKAQGILYPYCFGWVNHTKIAAYAQDEGKVDSIRKLFGLTTREEIEKFRPELEENLWRELKNDEYNKIVISNEHCSSRLTTRDELITLKNFLSMFSENIKIIFYVRPQDEAITSSYSTQVKSGGIDDFKFPLTFENAPYSFKYYQIAELWSSVFGLENLNVVPLHKSIYGVNDAVRRFFYLLQFPDNNIDYQGKSNESLDIYKLWFLKGVNKYFPLFESGSFNRRRSRIVSSLERSPPLGPNLTASFKERERVLKYFSHENSQLFKKYCGINENVFSKPDDNKQEVALPNAVDSDLIFKLVSDLFENYDENYLKK